jgi:predicted nucleotidyltransferase
MIDVSIKTEILDGLKELPYPFKLIVFGSHAYGIANEDSDIDLVVIIDKKGKSQNYKEFIENKMTVSKCLMPIKKKYPIDLLVYTKEEWDELMMAGSSFFKKIEQEGVAIK